MDQAVAPAPILLLKFAFIFLFSSSPCSPTGICLHRSLRVRPTTRLEGGGGGFSAVPERQLGRDDDGCGMRLDGAQSSEPRADYAEPRVGCIACSTHRCLKVVSVATAPNVAEPAQRTTEPRAGAEARAPRGYCDICEDHRGRPWGHQDQPWPRAAAGSGHGRLAEGERAF